jgi:hypothetical protein
LEVATLQSKRWLPAIPAIGAAIAHLSDCGTAASNLALASQISRVRRASQGADGSRSGTSYPMRGSTLDCAPLRAILMLLLFELQLYLLRTSQARNTRIAHHFAAAATSPQADRFFALARH